MHQFLFSFYLDWINNACLLFQLVNKYFFWHFSFKKNNYPLVNITLFIVAKTWGSEQKSNFLCWKFNEKNNNCRIVECSEEILAIFRFFFNFSKRKHLVWPLQQIQVTWLYFINYYRVPSDRCSYFKISPEVPLL